MKTNNWNRRPIFRSLVAFCWLLFATEAFAKKDFKGLFGSYRREKFVENEARQNAFGMDILLSTLLPVTPIVKSSETDATESSATPMNYAAFFNFETTFFFTMSYSWEIFANLGYYSYETRKENSTADPNDSKLPLFHQFEMDAVPLVLGLKYRFSTDDIVPYAGFGGGLSYVHRKAFYDYDKVQFYDSTVYPLVLEALGGVQFYFAPNAGLRLEIAAHYMGLTTKVYQTTGSPGGHPVFTIMGAPISLRYASGIFFMF